MIVENWRRISSDRGVISSLPEANSRSVLNGRVAGQQVAVFVGELVVGRGEVVEPLIGEIEIRLERLILLLEPLLIGGERSQRSLHAVLLRGEVLVLEVHLPAKHLAVGQMPLVW
jgi:hypothetical protein